MLETLRSAWWSMGPRVAEFERDFAEFCRAPQRSRSRTELSTTRRSKHSARIAKRPGVGAPPPNGVAPRLLTLALYGRMTDDQVEAGIDALRAVL
jgi:DegT/DnrJ/EryC1/StrS aminotransferase family